MDDIVQTLREDYQRFPRDQTYSIYAPDVYFRDPLNSFRGIGQYRFMIGVIQVWFQEAKLELHEIHREGDRITTRWTLSGNPPLPWQPRIAVPGRSELQLNAEGLICSHIDFWDCSRLDVLKQHFAMKKAG